jgi:hypothetical protein
VLTELLPGNALIKSVTILNTTIAALDKEQKVALLLEHGIADFSYSQDTDVRQHVTVQVTFL